MNVRIRFTKGKTDFLFSTASRLLWGPYSLLYNGYQSVKLPERETNNSPSSNAEVESTWLNTYITSHFFMA
jgi:hypothetical protein